jgi:multicomponent Na+:H+ antiporter subunit D
VPVLFIGIPFLVIVLIKLPFKTLGRKAAVWLALAAAVAQMGMALTVGLLNWTGVLPQFTFSFLAHFSIEGYAPLVMFTIGLIAAIALIVGKCTAKESPFHFINLVLIGMIGMNGIVMVNDLFALYVFLEVTAVASFILIAVYRQKDAFEGAFKYLVLSAVATVFMLLAIGIVLIQAKSVSFDAVRASLAASGAAPLTVLAFILFTAGLAVKAGLVPFHAWVPDAYSAAPHGASVMLSGIVTKAAGVYTLFVLFDRVFNRQPEIGMVLMIAGSVSIVIGALAALGQKDFKRMLAWSSISQVGYIVLGIGIGSPLAFLGAFLHFFNHATFKSLLFVNAAAVEEQTGTRDLDKLVGLGAKMPWTAGSSAVAFLSTAGIPPLSGFWSKLLIIVAAWTAGLYGFAVVAVLASLLTLGYFLVLQRKVFFGELAAGLENVKEACAGIKIAEIVLSVVIIAVGVAFPFVYQAMQTAKLFG